MSVARRDPSIVMVTVFAIVIALLLGLVLAWALFGSGLTLGAANDTTLAPTGGSATANLAASPPVWSDAGSAARESRIISGLTANGVWSDAGTGVAR